MGAHYTHNAEQKLLRGWYSLLGEHDQQGGQAAESRGVAAAAAVDTMLGVSGSEAGKRCVLSHLHHPCLPTLLRSAIGP